MVMTDKRRSLRKPIALRVGVSCGAGISNSEFVSAQTLNLSKSGALIESSDPMFEGEVCTFSLLTESGQSAAIRGHIIWVAQGEGDSYHAGVAFRNLTPDEEYLLDLQLVRNAK